MDNKLLDFIQYLSKRDKKKLMGKLAKVTEETGELARKIMPYENAHGTTHRFITDKQILEEVADVILSAISIAYDLDFSHEDIEEMLVSKSSKWLELQDKEDGVKNIVPYEMHVTIKAIPNIDYFKRICQEIEVKPIVLELEKDSDVVMKDFQTSSIFFGDNRGAYIKVTEISNKLKQAGFEVLREKIETIPWHPAAPRNNDKDPKMPANCYFESHISAVVTTESKKILNELAKLNEAHLSKNFFKKLNDNEFVNMITLRSYTGTYEEFLEKLKSLKEDLSKNGFKYEKEVVEFSIYDTKISHDASWLK